MTWGLSSTSDIDTTLYIEFNSLIMSIKMHHQNFVNINEFTIYITQTQTVLTLRITQQRKEGGMFYRKLISNLLSTALNAGKFRRENSFCVSVERGADRRQRAQHTS